MGIINHKESQGVKGMVTIHRYKAGTLERALKLMPNPRTMTPEALEVLKEGYIAIGAQNRNIVVSSEGYGRNLMLRSLIDERTYDVRIQYGEIGTGTTAVADADIALETPTDRVVLGPSQLANDELTLQFFFPDSTLADGSYTEFGSFCGGTATVGTGQLFNHALFASPYTKASGEDTTVEFVLTLS